MTTTLAPAPAAPAGAPVQPATARAAPPGRDLALFLILLWGTDFSGLLHIYGLSWLYAEPLFLGLGWAMVTIALALLLLPPAGRPRWLRFPLPDAAAAGALLLIGVPAALAAGFLLDALRNPPAWVARIPPPDTSLGGLLGLLVLQLAVLGAGPALAVYIAYHRDEATRRLWLAVLAGAFWLLALVNMLFDAQVGAHASDTWTRILTLGWPTTLGYAGLLCAAAGLLLLRPTHFLAAALGGGLALRVVGLVHIPLSIRLGDMLPLVDLAAQRLLQGHDPYIIYQMPWTLPLTDWPLDLLTYLPAAVTHADLRWTNLLVGPLLGALLVWAAGRRGPGPAAYALGLLYLSPTMLQWDLTTAAPPYWLWLGAAFAVAVAAPRLRWADALAGGATGAALAAAPLAAPFAPFLLGHWLATGPRVAVRRLVAAGAVFVVLVGPFVLGNPVGFWNGAVAWFNDLQQLPLLKWQTDRSWAFEIGLAGPFWANGLQDWLKPLQTALVGGPFVLGLGLRRRPLARAGAALRWAAAAYLLFMVVNPVIWPYLYVPALLALVFAQVPAALRAEQAEQ